MQCARITRGITLLGPNALFGNCRIFYDSLLRRITVLWPTPWHPSEVQTSSSSDNGRGIIRRSRGMSWTILRPPMSSVAYRQWDYCWQNNPGEPNHPDRSRIEKHINRRYSNGMKGLWGTRQPHSQITHWDKLPAAVNEDMIGKLLSPATIEIDQEIQQEDNKRSMSL